MSKNNTTILIGIITLSILMGHLFSNVTYAGDCDEWVAKIVSVQGDIQAKKTGTTQWMPVKLNDTFCPGDMLRVQQRSRAGIILSNESITRLDQNTSVTFKEVEEKKVSFIDILKGAAHFFSRVPRSLKFSTPFVNGAVEGTEFLVQVGDDQTLVSVFRGRVLAANDAGSISLGNGQAAIARAGKAPMSHLVVNPRDAVQWAVYYPAVIDYKVADFEGSDASWQGKTRKSVRFYRDGDLVNAFSSLDGVPENISDARFYIYRAGLLLTVGRVDEADTDINNALSLDAANSNALALQAIIAVAHNRKEEALDLANKAVAQDSKSSAAKVALSYAQQAGFNVQGALQSLLEAVKLSPEDALAHARLSELWMSVGVLDKALVEAQKSATLNPNLVRIQTVLGFAYLAQIKTTDAMAAFEKAITLDQAAPLPRLGLGLAKIREGDLKPGRAEIEIAAGLDPNSSLIRSYLGKAFFDEKRDKQSNSQLAIAKELDPQDPTPWFYDAIRKQTLNRPVEALHDLQKSIELNDNRAVYRSELLLDEDLAARSASLGRIYNDLGFQELALVEGYKSLNTDPSSHSAHRFLADSYAAKPRHEIARVSELLQSQLLQPINLTPVQPSLAESESFIYEGSGPSDASSNEFNPLFVRNRLALQASGVVGGNDIYGDEVVQSGVWGKMSYSVGQFHYQTDGFRENNDLEKDIYNVFVQTSLSHKTSIQVEYRYTETENGDLMRVFDIDDFNPTWRNDRETKTIRAGFHHAFTPNSDIIGSVIYSNVDTSRELEQIDPGPPARNLDLELTLDDKGYIAEIQHLFKSEHFHVISGVGHFEWDTKIVMEGTGVLLPPMPPISFPILSILENDTDHHNVYVYSQINYPENIFLTLGASVDLYEGGVYDLDDDQFNPKLGITWNVFPSTTFRAGAFRILTKSLPSSQTIEPTQVAGFNQFYDDPTATEAWNYGIGIDQKFTQTLFGGAEFMKRDLETPALDGTTVVWSDWEEQVGRVYLYWTPHKWLTASVEYAYERFERDDTAPEDFDFLRTQSLPLSVSFFHPSGLNARIKTTYVYQKGEFFGSAPTTSPDSDNFWVMDAAIGYRLPKRMGIFTIEGKNLLDKEFEFLDMDSNNPSLYPERLILAKLSLAF